MVALVGDNGAGKSTLIKAISGIQPGDSYEATFEGQPVHLDTPQDGTRLGIATVYQDLALADNLDVVENLYLGREESGLGVGRNLRVLDEVAMEKHTRELLDAAQGQDAQERAHGRRARCRAASGSRSRSRGRCSASRRS